MQHKIESVTIYSPDNTDLSGLFNLLVEEDYSVKKQYEPLDYGCMGGEEYLLLLLPMLPSLLKNLEIILVSWLTNNRTELHIKIGSKEITLNSSSPRETGKLLKIISDLGIIVDE